MKRIILVITIFLVTFLSITSTAMAASPKYVQVFNVKAIEYDGEDVEAVYIEFSYYIDPCMENKTVASIHISGDDEQFVIDKADEYINDNNTWYFTERTIGTLPQNTDGWYIWSFYERCDVDDFHIMVTFFINGWWSWDTSVIYIHPGQYEIEGGDDDDEAEFEFDRYYPDVAHLLVIIALIGFITGMLVLSLLPLTKRGYDLDVSMVEKKRSSYRFRIE
jgi:hypothetical protein